MQDLTIDLAGQVFTQSEIAMWDECSYKWYLKYYQLLNLKGELAWPLVIGTVWHKAIESLYRSKGKDVHVEPVNLEIPDEVIRTQEIEREIEQWQEKLEAMLQAYAEFYQDDFKVFKILDHEKTLSVSLEVDGVPITIAGKRDQKGYYGNKRIGIRDFKTTGQIMPSMTDGWNFKFQFMLYLWLDWKCSSLKERAEQFFVDVVRKPLLRQGKGEHIVTFAARIKQDMLAKPSEYFYRQQLDLTAKGVQEFEDKILMPKLKRIAILQIANETGNYDLNQVLIQNKNTEACIQYGKQCSYYGICYHGETSQYTKRKTKHEELENE